MFFAAAAPSLAEMCCKTSRTCTTQSQANVVSWLSKQIFHRIAAVWSSTRTILGTHVQGIKQLGSPPVDSLGSETRTKDLVSMGSFLFE